MLDGLRGAQRGPNKVVSKKNLRTFEMGQLRLMEKRAGGGRGESMVRGVAT